MEAVFTYLSNAFVAGAIGLVVGVIFSQKIKDFIQGVPAGFRTAMTAAEAQAKAEIKLKMQEVFAKYTPQPTVVTATVNPPPAAPAPTPHA